MPDRGDDGHRTGGDRPHEPLVAEGEQVLEAAAAPRDDDHVDLRLAAECAQRLDHGPGGARALHVRLADEHVRRRKTGGDRRQHVALRGRLVPGDEPDPPRQERQPPLPLRGEQALGGELLLQALQRGQVLADPEPLERERAEAELALRLVELWAAVDVHAVAVGEVEPQPVELAAGHRDAETGAVRGILEREEDAGPARLAAELGHLAFHPDRGQAREPGGDAAVERAHRVDPAVAVVDRLDFHTGEARSRSRSRSQARSLA